MVGEKYMKILLIIVLSSITYAVASDQCIPHPPCSCHFDDGRIIDLTPLGQGGFIEALKGEVHYYFHPCTNKNLSLPNVTANPCATGTSLCTYDHSTNTTTNIGKVDDGVLSPSKTDEDLYDITFLDKKSNKSRSITLICTALAESILHVSTQPSEHHDMLLFSKYACPHTGVHGLSTGSVLVIILLVLSGLYLLGGACVLHLLRGARGKELIPNIDFWSDLPLLVRDGVVFLQNGCNPPQRPGETYDRI